MHFSALMAFFMSLALKSKDEILSLLASRLRAQRLAQELSQQELARMAGLSLGAVRKLETSGQSSLETLVRVVRSLGLLGELESLFVLRQESIAQMEQREVTVARQRAPKRR